jgi:hypothetical protein
MFEALERAAIRYETRWTTDRELAASTLELIHSLYLLTAKANGAKSVGKPMRVPRPGDPDPAKPMSPAAFAAMVMAK